MMFLLKEFESPEYYTFDCMERCARLVFPKPRQLRAPGELCVANRCYKKMCDEPIRYAQVSMHLHHRLATNTNKLQTYNRFLKIIFISI